MRTIVYLYVLFFTIFYLHPQQFNLPILFKNDSSYLKLNNDTAEFKIYNNKLSYDYMKGKGAFYLKDDVIYINTVQKSKDNYPNFENIGQFDLNDKLLIEVFDQNNRKIPIFNVSMRGKRGKKLYFEKVCNKKICEINLNSVTKPVSIQIYAINNSNQKHFLPFKIPIKSIKTNKIKVYLTDVFFIENKIVNFELKKDENCFFVIGPNDIHNKKKQKYDFLKGSIIEEFYPCSDVSIIMYLENNIDKQ